MAGDMRKRIREQTNLARTYAEDGAYHSAARILGELAREVDRHAHATDRALDKLLSDGRPST